MGVCTVIALILIAAKAFGFLSISWLWCVAPILVDVVLGVVAVRLGFLASKKEAEEFGNVHQRIAKDTLDKAKDRLG